MEKAIELRNISKVFKKKELYRNVDFVVEKGTCVGIVGQNGAGKSVLFQIMTGLVRPDQGEVYINGKQLGNNGEDFPKEVGILINTPGYIDYYSGYKNLQLLAEIQKRVGKEEIQKTMKRVGLDATDSTPVKKYSMGMKQKLGIAQAIMEQQEIIILDEPYNALDYKANRDITEILKELKKEKKTLLLTSHQHTYLEKLCDIIYCIDERKLIVFDEQQKEKYFMD